MRKYLYALIFAALSALSANAGVVDFFNGVKLGKPLPENDLQYLGVPPVTTDKLLLIDFWATHCAPCVASISEINALHDKFAPKGLVIIGISDETEAKVKPFLLKHPMRYASAIEGSKSIHKALQIKALPYSIFVDGKGKIMWRGQPSEITDELVESMLKKSSDAGAKSGKKYD
jgi:thiol-disulfide isomerase/thioredoxin